MRYVDRSQDIWSLRLDKLAEQCHLIAEDRSGTIDQEHQHEAQLLSAGWKEALAQPEHDHAIFSEAAERKASQLAGLRKRTIELMVRFHEEPE